MDEFDLVVTEEFFDYLAMSRDLDPDPEMVEWFRQTRGVVEHR